MKRRVASASAPADCICVISGEELSVNLAFVLPCCEQIISQEIIINWLKQSKETACPCCRDATLARDRLLELGHDLTPIEVVFPDPISLGDDLIFQDVMAGIEEKQTIEERCAEYLLFGQGLMRLGRYRMAHDVIDHLDTMMGAENLSKKKPLIATTLLALLTPYVAYAESQNIPRD